MNEITIMPPGLPPGGIAVWRPHLMERKKTMTFAKGPPLTAAIHLLRQHPFYKQAVAHGGVVYKHMRHRAD